MTPSRRKRVKEEKDSMKRLTLGIKDAKIDSLRKRRGISKTKAYVQTILKYEVFNTTGRTL